MPIKPFKLKLTLTQRYILMFVLGIFIGSIVFIWKNSTLFPTMVLYHEINADRLTFGSINPMELLKYITEKRLQAFAILFLTQITLLKCPAACIYSFSYGFSGAILEGFYVQQYGPKGIALFLLTLLPHFLFYALTWHKMCTEKLFEGPFNKFTLIRTAKAIATCILFILAGMLCESTVNLWILRFFYQFLL